MKSAGHSQSHGPPGTGFPGAHQDLVDHLRIPADHDLLGSVEVGRDTSPPRPGHGSAQSAHFGFPQAQDGRHGSGAGTPRLSHQLAPAPHRVHGGLEFEGACGGVGRELPERMPRGAGDGSQPRPQDRERGERMDQDRGLCVVRL